MRLAYRVSGNPGSDPMVLLHGGSQDGSTWDSVASSLAKAWRVYTPDLRGHGRSPVADEYSFELMRDDVAEFLAEHDLRRVTLVGHSMGGVVAYLVAQDHPDRIDRLVLEETPPPFPMNFPVPEQSPVRRPIVQQLNSPDPRWWQRIAEVTAPTLVISGSDSFLPRDKVEAMAARFPNGTLVTLPAGHLVHAQLPAEFLAAMGVSERPAARSA
jgi:3-oxoadipate enol-lactonase